MQPSGEPNPKEGGGMKINLERTVKLREEE